MNTCHECGTKNHFYEKTYSEIEDIIAELKKKKKKIAFSRNMNINKEYDLLAFTEITSYLVILGTKFLILVQ